MKTLLFRALIAAVIIGPAIGFVSELTSFRHAAKYEPPLNEGELHRMGNLPMNEVEATFAKRRTVLSRWEWLEGSIHYSYFWKDVAHNAIVPSSGVFLGCVWVGWMEKRHIQRLKPHDLIA